MKFTITATTKGLFRKREEQKIDVEVEPDGVSLADVLAQAGVPSKGMQVSVDGKPISDTSMHLKGGAHIELSKAKKPRVEVTERASGS